MLDTITVYEGVAFMVLFIAGFTFAGYFGWLVRNRGATALAFVFVCLAAFATVSSLLFFLLVSNLSEGLFLATGAVYFIICIGAMFCSSWDKDDVDA